MAALSQTTFWKAFSLIKINSLKFVPNYSLEMEGSYFLHMWKDKKRTIKARNHLNKYGLMVLCYSFVYLYLMYCTHIWGSTYKTTLRRLVILQNKVMRIISDVKPRNSAGPLYKALNIMKCEDINIQIKYGLPYCVTCPSMSTDPGSPNPGTRRSRVPGWWDPGIRTNTGAGDTVLAKHT